MTLFKIKKNRFSIIIVLVFLGILVLTLGFLGLRQLSSKTNWVWAKVKVSQGLWWASTQKPPLWLPQAIGKGDGEYNLFGSPIVEVEEVRSYPAGDNEKEDRFNIYLTVKVAADYSSSQKKFTFKNSALAVGAPIELELGNSLVSGTVIGVSSAPFEQKYVERKVTLRKIPAFSWEYSAIKIGDEFSDGVDIVFKVLSKNILGWANVSKSLGENRFQTLPGGSTFEIAVTAKMKLRDVGGALIFGEEKLFRPGAVFSVATLNFDYRDFEVVSVE